MVLHRILVAGGWCEPRAARPADSDARVDLGKVGHANGWRTVPFALRVTNGADIPLLLTAHLTRRPSRDLDPAHAMHQLCLHFPHHHHDAAAAGPPPPEHEERGAEGGAAEAAAAEGGEGGVLRIERLQTGEVRGWLRPLGGRDGSNGVCEWDVRLRNLFNPANEVGVLVCQRG